MPQRIFFAFILLSVTLTCWSSRTGQASKPQPTNVLPASATAKKPILIELFTSEGCSSCPPADTLLAQLAQASPLPELEIIPLSEHVDYWNYIGWTDPFSSAQFSERQRAYAQAFTDYRIAGTRGDVYTPQMVVDGQIEFVGSRPEQARAALARAATLPKANLQIALQPLPAANRAEANRYQANVSLSALPPTQAANEELEFMLAIAEDNLSSRVTRGENHGRKLPHVAVTRQLQTIGISKASQATITKTATFTIADQWKRNDLRIIAFVQERKRRRVLGATAVRLPQ